MVLRLLSWSERDGKYIGKYIEAYVYHRNRKIGKKMHKIYVAAIEPLMEDGFYQKALSLVGEYRREKAEKMIQRSDKARSLAAGLLLHHAVNVWRTGNSATAVGRGKHPRIGDSGVCWDGRCLIGEHGKPALPKEFGLYFNLSHSGDYVLCAVADREIGADIQRHEKYEERLAERFFHSEELAYLRESEDRERCFYDLWCLKESCIKCTGRGLGTGLERFSVVPFFYGEEIMLDGMRCAGVCAQSYILTDLREFGERAEKEPLVGYSMAAVAVR